MAGGMTDREHMTGHNGWCRQSMQPLPDPPEVK
jgi:hypothetical protein